MDDAIDPSEELLLSLADFHEEAVVIWSNAIDERSSAAIGTKRKIRRLVDKFEKILEILEDLENEFG